MHGFHEESSFIHKLVVPRTLDCLFRCDSVSHCLLLELIAVSLCLLLQRVLDCLFRCDTVSHCLLLELIAVSLCLLLQRVLKGIDFSSESVDRVHDGFRFYKQVSLHVSVRSAIPLTTCERLFVGCTDVLHLE
jgi:hypothetical protein